MKKSITNSITNLLKVKSIVTFMVLTVFSVLALRGDIAGSDVQTIVMMVVAFYFGTQHEKNKEDDKNI